MNTIETKENFSVLIPDGESTHALHVLRCLGPIKNIRTYILSNDPWAPIRFSRYSDKFFSYVNENDDDARLAAIINTVKQMKVDIVLPVDFKTIRLLSLNSAAFSHLTSIAPLPQTYALDIASDKWLLSEWLKKYQIPCPPTILLKIDDGFNEAVSTVSFPVLIKPRRGSAGAGIEFFDDPKSLFNFCKEHVSSGEYILQSFINGYDIDCSVLCQEGKILAYTIQKGFMYGAQKISWPSGIDFLYDDNTYNIVREVIEKFNWTGIVHFDLRYDEKDKQIKVIEMNPRFWSSVTASTFTGVNFPYLACLAGLKKYLPEIVLQPKRIVRTSAAIRLLAKRFVHKRRADLHFDNSFIEFALKDPIPNVMGQYFKIYNKIFHPGKSDAFLINP